MAGEEERGTGLRCCGGSEFAEKGGVELAAGEGEIVDCVPELWR